jgi:hypothetical protein
MRFPVPEIEITDHGHFFRVGRPDGEVDALYAVFFADVAAQVIIEPEMGAFLEKIHVVFRKQGRGL